MNDLFTYAKKHLELDATTGLVYWRVAPRHHRELQGKRAGTLRKYGGKSRWYIKLKGKPVPLSRVIYFLHTNKIPHGVIDHINRNPLDNRPENLRDVTVEVNNHNHSRVCVRRLPSGKYQARIKQRSIGTYMSEQEAIEAYIKKRRSIWGT